MLPQKSQQGLQQTLLKLACSRNAAPLHCSMFCHAAEGWQKFSKEWHNKRTAGWHCEERSAPLWETRVWAAGSRASATNAAGTSARYSADRQSRLRNVPSTSCCTYMASQQHKGCCFVCLHDCRASGCQSGAAPSDSMCTVPQATRGFFLMRRCPSCCAGSA